MTYPDDAESVDIKTKSGLTLNETREADFVQETMGFPLGGVFIRTTLSMKSSGQTVGTEGAPRASLPPSDVMRSNPADPTIARRAR